MGKGKAAVFHSWADGFAVCRAATVAVDAVAEKLALKSRRFWGVAAVTPPRWGIKAERQLRAVNCFP